MKTRRHHNNSGRRATQRGKRKQEIARIADKLGVPSTRWEYCVDYYTCDRHDVSLCKVCKPPKPAPKQDIILERPEEEPGYGM